MRPRDLLALEFACVRARVADFALSAPGKEACLALAPTADATEAARRVERTAQCVAIVAQHGRPPLEEFADIRAALRTAAHEGSALDGEQLVHIRHVLRVAREVSGFFRRHQTEASVLADIPAALHAFPMLETSLTRALDERGAVLDHASEELARVRRMIRGLRETVTRRLEDLVARGNMADVVSDTFVTLRNARFVIPVRAGAATRLPGVVQDRSVSGETLFIEPLFAVELNNELLLAIREEEAIVRRILADLTALLYREQTGIGETFGTLVAVDALLAAAGFAREYGCSAPVLGADAIHVRAARHAGLLFTGREVTPIDLRLDAERHILVISGPNTGGKSVALKTLGLCALMGQSGLLIPAAPGARLPCFAGVFADVGDEQNIERNLSTFSAHIANLCDILAHDLGTALVLLDEPGVGTDPEEGAALAIGLVQRLAQLGARVAITTHYNPVKLFAVSDRRCTVAAVDFDVETLTPRYRLTYHSLGRSLALPIAQRLGLPAAVLDAARAAQSEESRAVSDALERLEETRRRLEVQLDDATQRASAHAAQEAESRRVLEELRQRRRSAWSEELREARDFVRGLKAEGKEVLASLQRDGDRAALERFVREQERAIRDRSEGSAPPTSGVAVAAATGPLRAGDLVEVAERNIRGELLSIDGERAWIQRGTLRFEVPAGQLRRIGKDAAPAVRVAVVERDEHVATEISLIGLRARDAVDQLHQFLDRAVQAEQRSVRIIHGVGSGALRHAVRDYLATSPYCSEFRAGEPGEGGDGVTVVQLE